MRDEKDLRWAEQDAPQAATYTCDWDGYTEDERGQEHYWHCEQPSVAVLPDGTQVCSEHVLVAMEQQP